MRCPPATTRAENPHSPIPSSAVNMVDRMRTSSDFALPPAKANGAARREPSKTLRVCIVHHKAINKMGKMCRLLCTLMLWAMAAITPAFGQKGILLEDLTWVEAEKILTPNTIVV